MTGEGTRRNTAGRPALALVGTAHIEAAITETMTGRSTRRPLSLTNAHSASFVGRLTCLPLLREQCRCAQEGVHITMRVQRARRAWTHCARAQAFGGRNRG
jgi:hypothetical protein